MLAVALAVAPLASVVLATVLPVETLTVVGSGLALAVPQAADLADGAHVLAVPLIQNPDAGMPFVWHVFVGLHSGTLVLDLQTSTKTEVLTSELSMMLSQLYRASRRTLQKWSCNRDAPTASARSAFLAAVAAATISKGPFHVHFDVGAEAHAQVASCRGAVQRAAPSARLLVDLAFVAMAFPPHTLSRQFLVVTPLQCKESSQAQASWCPQTACRRSKPALAKGQEVGVAGPIPHPVVANDDAERLLAVDGHAAAAGKVACSSPNLMVAVVCPSSTGHGLHPDGGCSQVPSTTEPLLRVSLPLGGHAVARGSKPERSQVNGPVELGHELGQQRRVATLVVGEQEVLVTLDHGTRQAYDAARQAIADRDARTTRRGRLQGLSTVPPARSP